MITQSNSNQPYYYNALKEIQKKNQCVKFLYVICCYKMTAQQFIETCISFSHHFLTVILKFLAGLLNPQGDFNEEQPLKHLCIYGKERTSSFFVSFFSYFIFEEGSPHFNCIKRWHKETSEVFLLSWLLLCSLMRCCIGQCMLQRCVYDDACCFLPATYLFLSFCDVLNQNSKYF